MPTLKFTVDSALLIELGERLVGKPHIALAELVKNGYDADASKVTIKFLPDEDCIEVYDNGHGMTLNEFKHFWMRVGTPHKDRKRVSRYLKRPMTGSKGVGRLSVQFLADDLTIRTVPKKYKGKWLEARVEWAKAVQAGDLTEATVFYAIKKSPPPFEQGTSIILSKLKHGWNIDAIQALAGELWSVQPPFRSSINLDDRNDSFHVDFKSSESEFEDLFNQRMQAFLRLWIARLVGKNKDGRVSLSLEFAGEPARAFYYNIADFPHNKGKYNTSLNLNDGSFEIRLFLWKGRQPFQIKVGEARDYFAKYGGVHVYDSGFRLPYYGVPENDWLRIEYDHSHRKNVSNLLPETLQVSKGLTHLPTLGRVFGVVNVNTSREPNLKILITRDRLEESGIAFKDLRSMVRYAIDLYAMERARREFERKSAIRPIEPTTQKFERIEQVLAHYEPEIPPVVYGELKHHVEEATTAVAVEQERVIEQIGLLGALATAGISALAYQHELDKQFSSIEGIIKRLEHIKTNNQKLQQFLDRLGKDLSDWVGRAKSTNALFGYLANAENTQMRDRFRALSVLKDVKAQTRFLARGIDVDLSRIDRELRLPEATLAEWGAIFQNVFINAFNAMLDSEERQLQVSSQINGKSRQILVQDTGQGVDLKDADRLFQPFERGLEISPERRALGYGGTGLGLTIVRLLTDRIGCSVGFVEPDEGFSTAFSLSWRETR